jgi:hypothetical protein
VQMWQPPIRLVRGRRSSTGLANQTHSAVRTTWTRTFLSELDRQSFLVTYLLMSFEPNLLAHGALTVQLNFRKIVHALATWPKQPPSPLAVNG